MPQLDTCFGGKLTTCMLSFIPYFDKIKNITFCQLSYPNIVHVSSKC